MEKLGWYEFRAEGLSLERLLNQCGQHGIALRDVRKASARAITGSVAAVDLQRIQSLADERGWRFTVLRTHGMIRVKQLARRRALLLAGVLVFFCVFWAVISCVWFIDVRGAGPYTGEIERILQEHDVHTGRFGFLINTDAIKTDMERQLTGLAWVGVQKNGVRLTIDCIRAQLAKNASTVPGDLVASRDGVISSIQVTAGTAAVKVGDVVRRGQLLVRGQERAWDGSVVPIRAEASVQARVWYTAEAYVSGTLYETVPTGESFIRRTICSPFYEYSFEGAPDYREYDVESTIQPIGGPFPIWLKTERYEAVVRNPVERDLESLQAEAGIAASRLAHEKIDYGVSVIDKWVEYSMIKNGGCRATAVLEAVVEIGTTLETI